MLALPSARALPLTFPRFDLRLAVLFFSTLGARSLADEIKGSDFDGDKISVIAWQPLVKLYVNPTKPYVAEELKRELQERRAPEKMLRWLTDFDARAKEAAARAKEAPKASEISAAKMEDRLVNNYIMARFMSSALVQSSATQWMIFADQHGANCWQCLLVRAPRAVCLSVRPARTSPMPFLADDTDVCHRVGSSTTSTASRWTSCRPMRSSRTSCPSCRLSCAAVCTRST